MKGRNEVEDEASIVYLAYRGHLVALQQVVNVTPTVIGTGEALAPRH
jgi:hypothetical protein